MAAAQTLDPESNWFKETGRGDNPYSGWAFRHYDESDVLRAKQKYSHLKQEPGSDEWEGEYFQPTMLGYRELLWRRNGFVRSYHYHTLVGLDYGTVATTPESISFRTEKPKGSNPVYNFELVKVKIGNSHFLVPEDHLRDFAERAAGITYEKDEDEDEDYWIKTSDEKLKVFGMPIFPSRYANLIRQPITATIERFGKPEKEYNRHETGEVYSISHTYPVYLNAGRNKGIRAGMWFYVDELDEWVVVKRAGHRSSTAELIRWEVDIGKGEQCFIEKIPRDDVRPCKPLRPGASVRTLSRSLNY